MSQSRMYRNPKPEEQEAVLKHEHHITMDTTLCTDARQMIYCKDCKVYFEAGEHPNVHAQSMGALA